MISCMIVDDEAHGIEQLTRHVQKTPGLELAFTSLHAAEALHQLLRQPVQLAFLDIQMPDLNGFDFIKAASTTSTRFILCTAHADYALDGFNHHVVDYLLKPVTYARFITAVQKAIQIIEPSPAAANNFIFIKGDAKHRQVRVNFADINYVEALNGYCSIHLKGQKLLTVLSLKELQERLPARQFMRVNKSFIVPLTNIDYVDAHEIKLNSPVVTIPIGAAYKTAVQDWMQVNR